jgi:hypothetical protein
MKDDADLIAALTKAGLSASEAAATAAKFAEYGYSLTTEYSGSGDHLVQNDDQMNFLLNRLLRKYSPLKRLDSTQAVQVFRSLGLDGWRIVLPKGPMPLVP